jgi:protein-S-isoprenylcysteine O-methyltransferase Ste14
MRNEERVLSETFPEYEAYAARTWRLIPGVY